MYFVPDADQEMLRDSVRRFMKSEVAPVVAEHDRNKTFPFELLKSLSQFGYIGGRLPEAMGGMDMDQMSWAMLMEEAGYTWLSMRTMVNITTNKPPAIPPTTKAPIGCIKSEPAHTATRPAKGPL